MRLKIAADGERFVTEHLVDGEARYAVGRATVVDSDQSSQRGGDLPPSRFGLFGRRRLGWLFTVLRRAFKSLTFARGGTEEYCLLVRLSLRIRNTDRYHPVASSPPSAHHDLSWSWGGGIRSARPRRTARSSVATVPRAGRSPMTSAHVPSHPGRLNNMECAILPHFRQPSAAVDYRVRVRIMIRRHNDRVREAYLSRISRL